MSEIVTIGKRREILMFGGRQRFVHWLHTAAFGLLLLTGLTLYMPWLSNSLARGEGGYVLRVVHRIGAVGFMVAPVLFAIFDPRGLVADMKRILTWGRDDWGWFRAAPRYYFLGDDEAMPPQDKFNTGQKIFYLAVVTCAALFILTGLIMWFAKGAVPVWMFQWSVFVHDLCTITYGAFFLLHLMLAVAHPLMRGALDAMIFGWVPEEYVKQHYAKYYQQRFGAREGK